MPDRPAGIDPRGPRFAASITASLLAATVFVSLLGLSTARGGVGWFAYQPLDDVTDGPLSPAASSPGWAISVATPLQRALDPGFLLLLVVALLFAWSVLAPGTAPWGVLFRRVIRPRLRPPAELEDPRPPRFAQGVGLFVSLLGLVLHLLGVPWALPAAAAMAFAAAFLNAVFGLCLGCMLYLALQRTGLVGRRRRAA